MKILVIQQKMIGDVLASTLICEHLKRELQNAKVHFLINENATAVVEGNPFVDKTVIFKNEYRKSKIEFYRFLKSIRNAKYDVVIDVLCKLESNLIALFSGAKTKISYKKWYSRFVYDHVFEYSQNEGKRVGLAIENRLLLLSPLIKKLQNPLLEPKVYLSKDEIEAARELLMNSGIPDDRPKIMVGVLGSGPTKTYPLPYLAKLLDDISAKCSVAFFLNYLPSQKEAVDELLQLCNEKTRESIHGEVFCLSLRSFLALLSQCDAYFGNEGGVTNMSKALGLPNFSIFSPWISKKGWFTYPEKSSNEAVHLSDFEPKILDIPKKERKQNVQQYYKRFTPELCKPLLLDFIEREVIADQ
ncbi:glycosyltransferase family 9 protein [Allomuricauda sp. d1]|uniref:glycosyltransferase family 9 protein n=1 Tax=Allomuricauda sp. d1 TaxID=3136725 RepID=UPI0031DF3BE9